MDGMPAYEFGELQQRGRDLLYPFLNPALLRRVAAIPRELADRWFSAFEDALARNEFLAVITIWVVTGVKPTVGSAW